MTERYQKIFLVLFLIHLTSLLSGQNGIPYFSHLESREKYEAENWSVCQDDHNSMLFANKKGLIRYDGNKWSKLDIPYRPLLVKQNPFNRKVYILSEYNYGYLDRDDVGRDVYVPLSFQGEISSRLQDILFNDSLFIVYGTDIISIHLSSNGVLQDRIQASNRHDFLGVIPGPGTIFVNTRSDGLKKISGNQLIPVDNHIFDQKEILFSLPYDPGRVLVGCADGSLTIFNGKESSPFVLSNQEYLEEYVLSDGLLANDSCLALSTLYGGLLIVRKKDGKVINTINYESGLPDDEIYSIGKDANNGIWITYDFGTCRIDLGVPIRDYTSYPGLRGLITNACWYNNELYVATTEGLYFLTEVKNYEEVEVLIREKVLEKPSGKTALKDEDNNVGNPEGERGGLLRQLFRKNRDRNVVEEEIAQSSEVPVTSRLVSKKVSKLKSIEYIYKKIPGINSRCESLLLLENGILAGSSAGIYLVQDHEATSLLPVRNVTQISRGPDDRSCFVNTEKGCYAGKIRDQEWAWEQDSSWGDIASFSSLEKDSIRWISGFDRVVAHKLSDTDPLNPKIYNFPSGYPDELYIREINDTLFLFSSSEIHYYEAAADSFVVYEQPGFHPADFNSLKYFQTVDEDACLLLDHTIKSFGKKRGNISGVNIWGLFDNITSFNSDPEKGSIVVDNYEKLYLLNTDFDADRKNEFQLFLESISLEDGTLLNGRDLVIDSKENQISINVTAPYFLKNQSTQYHFRIDGRREDWSKWSPDSKHEQALEYGNYTISIYAKNILDELSNTISVSFYVKPPFYRTTAFYLLATTLILAFFLLIIYIREKKLKRDKQLLEEKVQERTIEIQQQKEKIESQKDEILAQKNDITSSITYASRIQHAILPDRKIFEHSFREYFIYYRPRDIVSGDFYWITENQEQVIFAAADCTGHGVPGAFMSMLGNSFLNEITRESDGSLSSGEILDALRMKITEALSQSGEAMETRDGMDIALCLYHKNKNLLEFSGAYNPLYIVKNGELQEYKADRMPIGYFPAQKKFRTQQITVHPNDVIYLFSDGFPDQFGGPKGKKYTTGRFKQLLTGIWQQDMEYQLYFLEDELDSWRGNYEQVDDILVIGIRI